MTIDRATIINWALTDIGAGPMFSIDDGSDMAEQIEAVWQPCVDRVFGLTDWSFCKLTLKNMRRAETPENGWRFAFDLPGTRIGSPLKILHDPRTRQPLRDFALEGGKLYADVPESWSLCKVAVDPDVWPPDFRAAFVVALGGYLSIPIWQDADLRADKLAEAFGTPSQGGGGGTFGRLMAQDKAAAPIGSPLAQEDPVTNARFTGAGDHWAGRFA